MTPEARARLEINAMLLAAGSIVQHRDKLSLHAGPGVAVRQVPTSTGPADYLLFLDRKACAVLEAKPGCQIASKHDPHFAPNHGSSAISVQVTLVLRSRIFERDDSLRGHQSWKLCSLSCPPIWLSSRSKLKKIKSRYGRTHGRHFPGAQSASAGHNGSTADTIASSPIFHGKVAP